MDTSAPVSKLHLADPWGRGTFVLLAACQGCRELGLAFTGWSTLLRISPFCRHRMNRLVDAAISPFLGSPCSVGAGARALAWAPLCSLAGCSGGRRGCLGMKHAAKYPVTRPAVAHVIHLALLIQQWLGTASQEHSCGCEMFLSVN